jgi:hypothetical protein
MPAFVLQLKQNTYDAMTALAEATTQDALENKRRRRATAARLLTERLIELGYLKPEKEKEAPAEQ